MSDDEDEDEQVEREESDGEEAFPELDSGSEGDDQDDEEEDEEDEEDEEEGADSESESGSEDLNDEESGSESGYNSSDIERMYASSSTSLPPSPRGSHKNLLSTDEKLSRMIAKHSVKPDERIGTDVDLSTAKKGVGKLRPSKLVKGGYRREYEDIEAGYGSESSTEDVSARVDLVSSPTIFSMRDGLHRPGPVSVPVLSSCLPPC